MNGSPDPADGPALPVVVKTRFERFPASIKGAFVLRGGDGDPHAVSFDWARVARVPTGPAKPVTLEDRQLDVAPNRDLFVPFEVPVADMQPSWYVVESSLRVDGGRSYGYSGRPFTIPWPRSDVRKGTIQVARPVRAGDQSFHVERIELGWDAAGVLWLPITGTEEAPADGPPQIEARAVLTADGADLEELPDQAPSRLAEPRAAGERRTLTYPLMRSARSLHVSMRVPSGGAGESLVLQIP